MESIQQTRPKTAAATTTPTDNTAENTEAQAAPAELTIAETVAGDCQETKTKDAKMTWEKNMAPQIDKITDLLWRILDRRNNVQFWKQHNGINVTLNRTEKVDTITMLQRDNPCLNITSAAKPTLWSQMKVNTFRPP